VVLIDENEVFVRDVNDASLAEGIGSHTGEPLEVFRVYIGGCGGDNFIHSEVAFIGGNNVCITLTVASAVVALDTVEVETKLAGEVGVDLFEFHAHEDGGLKVSLGGIGTRGATLVSGLGLEKITIVTIEGSPGCLIGSGIKAREAVVPLDNVVAGNGVTSIVIGDLKFRVVEFGGLESTSEFINFGISRGRRWGGRGVGAAGLVS
jgi:hypothetical protein